MARGGQDATQPARVVVVDDLEAARAGWKALREYTVITRDGDVLTEHVLRGGSGGGRSKLELVAERDSAAVDGGDDRLGHRAERLARVGDGGLLRQFAGAGGDQVVVS